MNKSYPKLSLNSFFLDEYNSHLIDFDNFCAWCIEVRRDQLQYINSYDNLLNQPWVYFLWSRENGIYVGETENLLTRAKEHFKKGHFFEKMYCFSSINDYINKAHIKVLEYLCYEALKNINCPLLNKVSPTQSRLSEKDKDYCNTFLELIKRSLVLFNLIVIWEQEDEREFKKIDEAIHNIEMSPLFNYEWKAQLVIEQWKLIVLKCSQVHESFKKYEKVIANGKTLADIPLETLSGLNLLITGKKTHNTKQWVDEEWKSLFEYLNL